MNVHNPQCNWGQEINEKIMNYTQVLKPQAIPFEIPEGYVTGDEFVRRVKEKLIASFKADGLL
ncbi:hypothetical protein FACS189452_02550 [Bacteroidia bacterium]|nr:hypothetical protein FACS189452_02550 [Bacteroidia bacterium]